MSRIADSRKWLDDRLATGRYPHGPVHAPIRVRPETVGEEHHVSAVLKGGVRTYYFASAEDARALRERIREMDK